MVEVKDLLPQGEIFQQGRAGGAGAQGILVVRDHDALRGGQTLVPFGGVLVDLSARPCGRGQGRDVGALLFRGCHVQILLAQIGCCLAMM